MGLIKGLKVRKYHYDIFLRPLKPFDRFRVVVHKMKKSILLSGSPDALEIGLTYRCQLNCIHCGVHGQYESVQPELDADEIKTVISQAQELGIYLIVFSGGEPLMRGDMEELLGYAARKGLVNAISTNGQLLTSATIRALKENRVSFINISLDSASETTHDRYRGLKGCFRKAEEAIRACAQEGLSVIVSTYATKENIYNGDLKQIIQCAKDLKAKGVRILLAVPSGKWLGCPQVVLSEQEKSKLHKLLDPLYVYIEGVCNKFTECNAVAKKLFYVSPCGEVQPCSFVPVYFGNIRKEPLSDIWNRMRTHSFFSHFDGSDCIMRDKNFSHYFPGEFKNSHKRLILMNNDEYPVCHKKY